jgi:hypothetical protein
MQDTTVTTDMQVIQMPGPMKIDLEFVWMAVMIRGVCSVATAAAAGNRHVWSEGACKTTAAVWWRACWLIFYAPSTASQHCQLHLCTVTLLLPSRQC